MSIGSIILTFFYAVSFLKSVYQGDVILYTFKWILVENFELNFSFLLDHYQYQ